MKNKYVIIIGCGKLGSTIANTLSKSGHSIVMIDSNEKGFELLNSDFSGFKIQGDANEFFILQQAKIEKADFVLALTNDDNLNIMLAQICQKIYNVKNVVARIYNPQRQKIYEDLGIKSICPTLMGMEKLVEIFEEWK